MATKNKFELTRENRFIFTRDAKFSIVQRPDGMATLKAYPITFNTLSDDRGGYKVRIMPGSPMQAAQVFAVVDHNFEKPLGVSDVPGLRILPTDDHGIPIEVDLPDTSYARDLQELVAKKIVRGMSFAAIPETVESHETEESGQRIVNFDRFCFDEVTFTAIPAFSSTSVEIKDPTEDEEKCGDAPITLQTGHVIRLHKLRLAALAPDQMVRN